jgi:hypothetical protein
LLPCLFDDAGAVRQHLLQELARAFAGEVAKIPIEMRLVSIAAGDGEIGERAWPAGLEPGERPLESKNPRDRFRR